MAAGIALCRGDQGCFMANVVVVGSQWGDEGKGKIVDWLSEQADIVVRFQGGHNAGHTLVVDGTIFRLSLLPSGIIRPGKLSVIGNGVVLDPTALIEEIDRVAAQGVEVTPDNLRIADNTTLILSLHRDLDALRETSNALTRIGTTKRGIGPAYEDKVGRRAIRLMDLADLPGLGAKIARLLVHHNALRCGRGLEPSAAKAVFEGLAAVAPRGLAYTTRVGEGPFPTEQQNEIGLRLGERGREFGTVTGRARRCGWFDAVLVRQTVRTSGINGLALTKLDILDGFDEIKVCIGYRLDGVEFDYLPAGERAQARLEPIYETIEGWRESTAGARSWADLPAQAIKYVRRIEELIGCTVALLSTSPEREDTILVQNPFEA